MTTSGRMECSTGKRWEYFQSGMYMNRLVLHKSFNEVARLFLAANDEDAQELSDDLSGRFARAVNKETGEVTCKETDGEVGSGTTSSLATGSGQSERGPVGRIFFYSKPHCIELGMDLGRSLTWSALKLKTKRMKN